MLRQITAQKGEESLPFDKYTCKEEPEHRW